ncbi:hypothetical protein NP493_86g04003 [Ridgeia piscesae]|uniref:Uncharacterized protein n=1 Tax=Ridgeia piscesae TaxID=27915 RepID=A0AAD9UI33_RIDPI|nr:hypothetical protein NP493_86g04003 [Ridgeia piscesae]
MSFNDFDSSAAERNPWVDEDTRAIENVLLVCQKTGHVTHTLANLPDREEQLSEAQEKIPSLRLIVGLSEVNAMKKKIYEAELEIQRHRQDKETQDVTNLVLLEQRVSQLDELNSHFQAIEEHKEKLAARLQQPYVGEFLRIDAAYKKYASDVIPRLVPILSDLSKQLGDFDSLSKEKNDFTDGQLVGLSLQENLLGEVTQCLSSLQATLRGLVTRRDKLAAFCRATSTFPLPESSLHKLRCTGGLQTSSHSPGLPS